MDERAAGRWLSNELRVSRETVEQLTALAQLIRASANEQNLVAASTVEHVLVRHIVDSAQLVMLATDRRAAPVLDLGSGAGLPGLVWAIVRPQRCILVESRRLRADFLRATAERLGLTNVVVHGCRLESVPTFAAAIITARAFAPLAKLLPLAHRFATSTTQWLLPKGRSAAEELASVSATWQGSFEMKPSITDPDGAIIVATDVRPRRSAR